MIDFLMLAIFIAAFAIMAVGVYIVRVEMYRTLRRYDVDPYSRGWRFVSSNRWVLKYKEVCIEHDLTLRYWNLYRLCVMSSGVLVTIWLALFIVQAWRMLAR